MYFIFYVNFNILLILILFIFKDEEALKDLELKFNIEKDLHEKKDDSKTDIKVEELLEDLNLHDKEEENPRKDSLDNEYNHIEEEKVEQKDKNKNSEKKNKKDKN